MYNVGFIWTLIAFSTIAVTTPSTMLDTNNLGIITSSATVAVKRIPVIVGGEVDLPCDTRPPIQNDSLILVVWYRDNNPVYSYDTRLPPTSSRWVDEAYLGRAIWQNTPSTGLHVKNVLARDRAVYRCRVDFFVSPTRNYKIALDVVELPSKPVIFDDSGNKLSGIAGPYYEGGDFKLICTVTGGYPTPQILWLQDDIVLDSLSAGVVMVPSRSLALVIRNATRSHLSAVYTCSTDNTLLVESQKTTVKIDMYLRPLTIDIVSREQPFSEGRKAELLCKTTGSRPPATITWWLGDEKMVDYVTKADDNEANETESLFQWTTRKEHDGLEVRCRAENRKFSQYYIEKKIILNVYFMPVTTIRLGEEVNPNDIEEGDDIYFICEVYANPPAYKIVWEHNGMVVQQTNRVFLTGRHLAIQVIKRHHAGRYTCTASNVEGDGKSQNYDLKVIYRPVCQQKESKIIGGMIQETTIVHCEVDAFPPPDTFEWSLNNSAGKIILDPITFTIYSKKGLSILTYKPVSDVDYGTLSCRATNLAGHQLSPCLYTLLPASKPETPNNCSVHNITDSSLDLYCSPGYGGGLRGTYIVEVWSGDKLVANASSGSPIWNIKSLAANNQLQLLVYAANAKGKSNQVTLNVETSKLPSVSEAEPTWEVNWATGVMLGAALTLTTVTLSLAVITTKVRPRSGDYEVTLSSLKKQKVVIRNSSHCTEEKNPDLIPCSKGLPEIPPEPPSYSTIATLNNSKMQTTIVPTYTHFIDNQNNLNHSIHGQLTPQREIVTTKTPFSDHQESRV